jgi:integrase
MIWINGKPVKSPLFRRKSDCASWKAKQMTLKAQQEILGENQNIFVKATLRAYADEWLKIKKPSLQRSTNEEYERYFRLHINGELGDRELKAITRKEVEILQSKLLAKLSPKTTNLITTVLKSVFADALENGYITKDPCKSIKDVKEDPPSEIFWSMGDINLFSLWAEKHDQYLFDFTLFALNTGMRRGEVAALEFDDISFQLKIAHVFKTRDRIESKKRTKTADRRAVPLNTIAVAVLQKRFNQRRPGQKLIFTEANGSDFDIHHLYRRFAKAQRKAGIENVIRFHDTRTSFATHFMMNGGDVYQLQKILGHAKIEMTMRYAKYSPKYLQDAVSNFTLGKEFNHILTTAAPTDEKVRVFSVEKHKRDVEISEEKQSLEIKKPRARDRGF